jgi:purine nucleosidase
MAEHRIIIDCDPGVDDAVAIMLALASPEIDVLGITCVAGNVGLDRTAGNAARIRTMMGRSDVPVLRGCASTLAGAPMAPARVHGKDGLSDIGLADNTAKADAGDAVEFLVQTIMDKPAGAITLCAIGPMTNVATAFMREPALSGRLARLLFMGGAAFVPGNTTPAAEFNIYSDPLAARLVLAGDMAKTMLGLDVTRKMAIDAEALDELAKGGPASAAHVTHRLLSAYGRMDPALHDPCVIAHLIDPGVFRSVGGSISVDCTSGESFGRTRVDPGEGTDIVVDGDKNRFFSLIGERLAGVRIADPAN